MRPQTVASCTSSHFAVACKKPGMRTESAARLKLARQRVALLSGTDAARLIANRQCTEKTGIAAAGLRDKAAEFDHTFSGWGSDGASVSGTGVVASGEAF